MDGGRGGGSGFSERQPDTSPPRLVPAGTELEATRRTTCYRTTIYPIQQQHEASKVPPSITEASWSTKRSQERGQLHRCKAG